jgi:phospholipid/cholesterol/gamma-HCH transport system substrate-binding protein
VAPRGVPGLKYYRLDAQFADASQIADLSEVRIAGRHVGQVIHSDLSHGKATVELQFFPGQKSLPTDTTARIRLKGLLGAKFVDVTPGHSRQKLSSGAILPVKQTSSSVELLDVLQAFDPSTRRALQASVRSLGGGFLGRGDDLNKMLDQGPVFYGNLGRVSNSITARRGAAARFAPSVASLSAAYDPVRQELASGFRPEATVMQAFDAKRPQLDRTLREAPGAMQNLRAGLTAATPLLNETAALARDTIRITHTAPAALRETTGLLRKGTPALRDTRPLLVSLANAVPPTLSLLRRLDPVIDPSVRALRNNVPVLTQLGVHGCDVLMFARNWRSSLGFGVAPGVGDPIGTLDEAIPGLGPINSLRVLVSRPFDVQNVSADAPPPIRLGRDAYPSPCAAVKEMLR